MALGLEGQTTKLLASVMPGQLAMSVAAAIGLNRGIIEPNLYNSLIVLAASSVFVSSMLFRYFSDRDRQRNNRMDVAWRMPKSRQGSRSD